MPCGPGFPVDPFKLIFVVVSPPILYIGGDTTTNISFRLILLN
ncbi:putative ORfan [Saudi moumouvirus]|nr:putative ORfan [Saudi moumouvirus]